MVTLAFPDSEMTIYEKTLYTMKVYGLRQWEKFRDTIDIEYDNESGIVHITTDSYIIRFKTVLGAQVIPFHKSEPLFLRWDSDDLSVIVDISNDGLISCISPEKTYILRDDLGEYSEIKNMLEKDTGLTYQKVMVDVNRNKNHFLGKLEPLYKKSKARMQCWVFVRSIIVMCMLVYVVFVCTGKKVEKRKENI